MFDDDGDDEEASCRDAADGSTQTVAPEQEPQPDLMREALRARDRLRWAERLQRKKLKGETRFTRQEEALLEDLAAGTLHDAADSATRKSGWGRIKNRDGTFEDIAPHGGGIVRTVLDNVDPSSSGDVFLDAIEPDDSSVPCSPQLCELQSDALPAAILFRLLFIIATLV